MSDGVFRKKKKKFAQISNALLQDENLSLKAKGLYGLIESYINIPDFTLYKNMLRKKCKEGDTAFDNAWKELKDSGYLIQHRINGAGGKWNYEYELKDDSNHTPENHPMDNPLGGKGGSYSNTDLSNTDPNNTDPHVFTENGWMQTYLSIQREYGLTPKRISEKNIEYVERSIEYLKEEEVTLEVFTSRVRSYFDQLPSTNDGDIVAFIAAIPRIFCDDISVPKVIE